MRYAIILAVLLCGCSGNEVPLSPGGVVPRDMDARQWDRYVVQSGIQADGRVKTFTPTWSGFSVDPTGDLKYMDFGAIVMIWIDGNGTGTSNSTSFSIAGMPEAIRPSAQRSLPIIVMDNGLEAPARMIVDTDGTAFFQRMVINGANLEYSTIAFTAASTKGWVSGSLITYAK